MTDNNSIAVYILAGGKSSRMGADKGLLLWNGKPFVEHIIHAAQFITDKITIVSSNSEYDRFGCSRIEDKIKNSGPLAGVQAALMQTSEKHNLVLSCDAPAVTSVFLQWLLKQHKDWDYVTVPLVDNRPMPLMAIYNKKSCLSFSVLLQQNERRMMKAIETVPHSMVEVPSELKEELININTPQDLEKLQLKHTIYTMMLKIRYFGMLAEVLEKAEEEITLPVNSTLADVRHQLTTINVVLKERTYKIALNTEMDAADSTRLKSGDELSFLPPFAGG